MGDQRKDESDAIKTFLWQDSVMTRDSEDGGRWRQITRQVVAIPGHKKYASCTTLLCQGFSGVRRQRRRTRTTEQGRREKRPVNG